VWTSLRRLWPGCASDGVFDRLRAAIAGRELSPWLSPALTDDTKPLNPAFLRFNVWYKVLEHAKLRAVRLHDLRHTYASLLLQAGEPIAYVKDQLGHSSIQVTVDLYGHLVAGANRGAVDRQPKRRREWSRSRTSR
jgi:integrase